MAANTTSFNFPVFLCHHQVILYSGDRTYEDYYEPMVGRVHFNSPDPKKGDASINLTGLKPTDSGTYQCKVKKAPGIRSRKMQLIVMGEWTGMLEQEKNSDVKLVAFLCSQGKFSLTFEMHQITRLSSSLVVLM